MKHPQPRRNFWGATALLLGAMGCTQVVDIDLPDTPSQAVLEGTVRVGEPALFLFSTTQGYFDPVDLGALASLYVGDAQVTLHVDGEPYVLDPLCTGDLPPEALGAAAELLGIDEAVLATTNICAYVGPLIPEALGAVGRSFDVEATWARDGQTFDVRAQATVPDFPGLDSAWFEVPATSTNDSLGFIWTAMTEAPGLGNGYRWSSKRVNRGEGFSYELGSVFDDAFLDGQALSFFNFRAPRPGEEEVPGEEGFWKVGDTVVVRLEAVNFEAFETLRDFETAAASQGNPFALPTSASSMVEGGLGWFAAYAGRTDTVVCRP